MIEDDALLQLGRVLQSAQYDFAPVSVADVKRQHREGTAAASVEVDLFGWGRMVGRDRVPQELIELMMAARALLAGDDGKVGSKVRAATVGGLLCLHNSGPGASQDAVFVGPDTARYIAALPGRLESVNAPEAVAEVGCGSGAAAIWLARRYLHAQVIATDVNPAALKFAAINAALAGVHNLTLSESDGLAAVMGSFDLIICNPPFIADPKQRTYRDGGGQFGMALPARIVREGVARLKRGGRLLMYTASPMSGDTHVISRLLADVPHTIEVIGEGQFEDLMGTDAYRGIDAIQTVMLSAPSKQ